MANIYLPTEIILLAAAYLIPRDQLSLLHVVPELTQLLTFRHSAIQDEEGNAILHLLARGGKFEDRLIRLLLANSSTKPYVKNKKGRTALSFAAEHGHEAVVKLLVERDDVDANSKDDYGRTALWRAAKLGYDAVVKLLLERDDVDAVSKDDDGQTPLWWAIRYGYDAVIDRKSVV